MSVASKVDLLVAYLVEHLAAPRELWMVDVKVASMVAPREVHSAPMLVELWVEMTAVQRAFSKAAMKVE